MQDGDEVTIYDDPLTQTKLEGKAVLRELVRPDYGDGLSLWLVEFLDEPGELYERCVYAPEA